MEHKIYWSGGDVLKTIYETETVVVCIRYCISHDTVEIRKYSHEDIEEYYELIEKEDEWHTWDKEWETRIKED